MATTSPAPGREAGPPSYYTSNLPPHIRTRLESGAFRSLCSHLRDRSDAVQNIDLMTVGGFCRNCLSKWLVLEARRVAGELRDEGGGSDYDSKALDALGYDEASEFVYGTSYSEWKAAHAKKATEEQMERYAESKPIHAQWDKAVLKTRGEKPEGGYEVDKGVTSGGGGGGGRGASAAAGLASDVCCQDVDAPPTSSSPSAAVCEIRSTGYTPPPPPPGRTDLILGILTVSDRASTREYESGDLSGPAVERAVEATVKSLNASGGGTVSIMVVKRAVVPDEEDDITGVIRAWCDGKEGGGVCDLVLTTGGTGFAARDVTPEATLSVLDRESRGLMGWVSAECATRYGQPMAPLSRAVSGVRGRTVVANLPGNPRGAQQVVEVALPLLVRAARDLKEK